MKKTRVWNAHKLLSTKAYEFYSNTDPIELWDHGNGLYSVGGCFELSEKPLEYINEVFEDW